MIRTVLFLMGLSLFSGVAVAKEIPGGGGTQGPQGGVTQAGAGILLTGTGIAGDPYILSIASQGPIGTVYGGGKIGCTTASGGIKNLIARTDDDDGGSGVPWSLTTNGTVPDGATSFTDGAANTAAAIVQDPGGPSAIQKCTALGAGGFNDWYLPARDELNCLYENQVAIGGFVAADYWSSTEFNAFNAWSQTFVSGGQGASSKLGSLRVRCVRAL
jgi:hypothetical protein